MTVWPAPIIMPPACGSHCSRNSRWLTVPCQHPCSQSSDARVGLGAGAASLTDAGAAGCPALAGGGAVMAGGAAGAAGEGVAGVADDWASAPAEMQSAAVSAQSARAPPKRPEAGRVIVSLRPRERQVH